MIWNLKSKYVLKNTLLQACFKECVFTGGSSLSVFGITAVRGSWSCLFWTVWDVQSSDGVSQIKPWEKAPEIGIASLAHSGHSWHHLQSSSPERCMHYFLFLFYSNTSVGTFIILCCFVLAVLRCVHWGPCARPRARPQRCEICWRTREKTRQRETALHGENVLHFAGTGDGPSAPRWVGSRERASVPVQFTQLTQFCWN